MDKEKHAVLFNHNIFIVWNPEYNLGIPIIDEHHRGIVTTINSLYFAMQNNYMKETLVPIIDMMKDYTQIHFRIEESFLEQLGHEKTEKHIKLHQALSAQLANKGRESMLGKDPYPFMEFLKQWWIHHICSEDLIYREYLPRTEDSHVKQQ
ncbi:MAG: hemerythrin family protein [Clostridiales bacterium]|nr:hemerythrin family protein [Clostridiales bacterium]